MLLPENAEVSPLLRRHIAHVDLGEIRGSDVRRRHIKIEFAPVHPDLALVDLYVSGLHRVFVEYDSIVIWVSRITGRIRIG